MRLQCQLAIDGADLNMSGSLNEIKVQDVSNQLIRDILTSHLENDLLRVHLKLVNGGMAALNF